MHDDKIAMCKECTSKAFKEAEPCPEYQHEKTKEGGMIHHWHTCKKYGEQWERCTLKTKCMIKIIVNKMEKKAEK